MNSQLHAIAALPPSSESSVNSGEEALWTSEPSEPGDEDQNPCFCRDSNPDRLALSHSCTN
jgi:hypothetical protein